MKSRTAAGRWSSVIELSPPVDVLRLAALKQGREATALRRI
jgi:hypothetical protein